MTLSHRSSIELHFTLAAAASSTVCNTLLHSINNYFKYMVIVNDSVLTLMISCCDR
jgi:hypothetical protein